MWGIIPSLSISSTVPVVVFVFVALPISFQLFIWLQHKHSFAKKCADIPGPKGFPIIGVLPDMITYYNELYYWMSKFQREFGDTFRIPSDLFRDGFVLVTRPEEVKHILSTNFNNYVKPRDLSIAFNDFLGNGIFNVSHVGKDADVWKLERKISVKAFTTNKFRAYTENVFCQHALELTEDILKIPGCRIVDMQDIALQFTLNATFEIGFGTSISTSASASDFSKSFDYINEHCILRYLLKPYFRWFWWCMPSEYKFRKCMKYLGNTVDGVVSNRLSENASTLCDKNDILSLFIKKRNDDIEREGKTLVDLQMVKKMVISLFLAGRDTTASTITYLFHSLSKNNHVQEKLMQEIDEAYEKFGGTLSYDNIGSLKYLDSVVYETLRLFPPVPFDPKMALNDDYLPDGTFIPAGCEVYFCPWVMGRDERRWENAEQFQPERWMKMDKKPNSFEFPVFQAGPRICIGMNLAIIEVKIFAYTMLRKFWVRPTTDVEPSFLIKPVLYMNGGLHVEMIPRNL